MALSIVGVPAIAAGAEGPDTTLCRSDEARVSIPGDLVVNACFDGTRLVLMNPTVFVLRMSAQGDMGNPIRRLPGAPTIAASTVALQEPDPKVMPPGFGLMVPVGRAAASIRIVGDPRGNRRYVLARTISQYLPEGFSVYDALPHWSNGSTRSAWRDSDASTPTTTWATPPARSASPGT